VFERLATFTRFIIFDKRGTGLSDRPDHLATLEERIDDIRAVMDACGSERAHLLGFSEGGSMAMRIAELRKSECCPVIGQIEVASARWDKITSPETELTSRWCSNSRTSVEPM